MTDKRKYKPCVVVLRTGVRATDQDTSAPVLTGAELVRSTTESISNSFRPRRSLRSALQAISSKFTTIKLPTDDVDQQGVASTQSERGRYFPELTEIDVGFELVSIGDENPYAIAENLCREGHPAYVLGPVTPPPATRSARKSKKTAPSTDYSLHPDTSILAEAIQVPTADLVGTFKGKIKELSQPSQGYLESAPVGVGARKAWSLTKGDGVQLAEVEQGWVQNHIELIDPSQSAKQPRVVVVHENQDYFGHGAAVLGIVAAFEDNFGVTGIAPALNQIYAVSQCMVHPEDPDSLCYATAQAIRDAADKLKEGDVLLIEAQTTEPGDSLLLPVEIEMPVFKAIEDAVKKGLVVVEAAGNGNFDLDDWSDINGFNPLRRRSQDFRDSGAIMVAGSVAPAHSRAKFSNYGSRIDCFAWGEGVCTAGDGLRGRSRFDYTEDFSGTSAAAAIIAGVAILVQSYALKRGRKYFDSKNMRSFLSDLTTGTRSANPRTDQIGVMPDLKKILAAL